MRAKFGLVPMAVSKILSFKFISRLAYPPCYCWKNILASPLYIMHPKLLLILNFERNQACVCMCVRACVCMYVSTRACVNVMLLQSPWYYISNVAIHVCCSQQSNLLNQARLRVLKAREDHIQVRLTIVANDHIK